MDVAPIPRRGVIAVLLALGVLAGTACQDEAPGRPAAGDPRPGADDDAGYARNVILIVGDGMGMAHRELVRLTTVGRDGALAMEQLTYQGSTRTDPADRGQAFTDSAAAATALATGTRTAIGAIAVDRDGRPLPTLLEQAAQAGRATGLVTTSRVTDATPAAFAAHVPDRDREGEIARQYIQDTGVDLILGGGGQVWQETVDGQSLLDLAQRAGYRQVDDARALGAAEELPLLGLFAPDTLFEADEDPRQAEYDPAVPLPVMAAAALDLLAADPDGFFLVIEEEGIDAMAHVNNADLLIDAGRALDDTVALARQFATEDGHTLLLVVGDHETGGLALESVSTDLQQEFSARTGPFTVAGTDLIFDVEWTSAGHTGAATPASAEGPGAQGLVGVRDNTDVYDLVLAAMTP